MSTIIKILIWAMFAVIAAVLLVLFNKAPLFEDDNIYIFLFSGSIHDSLFCHERISSVGDIVSSMAWHWQNYGNGRLVPHALLEIANMLPPIWAPLNTLMLLMVPALILKTSGKRSTLPAILAILALYWLTNPSPRTMIIWRAGSANYLWGSVGILFSVYLWSKLPTWGWRKCLMASIAAFLVGNCNESLTVGFAAPMLAFIVLRKQHAHMGSICFLAAFSAGIALNVFSPASQGRLESCGDIFSRIIHGLAVQGELISGSFLPVILLTGIAAACSIRQHSWKGALALEHSWPLIAAGATTAIVTYSGNVFERSMYGSFFFLFVYAARELHECIPAFQSKISRYAAYTACCLSFCLFMLIITVSCRQAYRNHERDMAIINYCRNNPGQVCIMPAPKPAGCISRWTIDGNRLSRPNSMLAKYYHIPEICTRTPEQEQELTALLKTVQLQHSPLQEAHTIDNIAAIIPLGANTKSIVATADNNHPCRIDTCSMEGQQIAVIWNKPGNRDITVTIRDGRGKSVQHLHFNLAVDTRCTP